MKLWGVLRKKQKMMASKVAEVASGAAALDEAWLHEAIGEICHALDVARPLVLKKHADDFNKFSRVVFKKDDFIESVGFDQFEIEMIDEEKKKRDQKIAIDD